MLGLFYYLASRDFPKHSSAVLLGLIGKVGVNFMGLVHVVLLKTVSWQLFLVSGWDLIFAVYFARALLDLAKNESKVE